LGLMGGTGPPAHRFEYDKHGSGAAHYSVTSPPRCQKNFGAFRLGPSERDAVGSTRVWERLDDCVADVTVEDGDPGTGPLERREREASAG
jgi:hypothetical protein